MHDLHFLYCSCFYFHVVWEYCIYVWTHTHICAYRRARGRDQMSLSSYLIPLRHGLSLNFKFVIQLDWLASKLPGSVCLCPQYRGSRHEGPCMIPCNNGTRISLCLYNKHSQPLNHLPTPLLSFKIIMMMMMVINKRANN